MIASLRGQVADIQLGGAVIECAGVGYFVHATPSTLATLRRGEDAFVHVTMVVREDAMTLFGFDSADSKAMFSTLQSVSGLGPKLALAALAMYSPDQIATFINSSDAKQLQRIPGVGKRMAERMIVDLKDKVQALATVVDNATPAVVPFTGGTEIVEALVGLGFPERSAMAAVDEVLAENPDVDRSTALRLALARLGRK